MVMNWTLNENIYMQTFVGKRHYGDCLDGKYIAPSLKQVWSSVGDS